MLEEINREQAKLDSLSLTCSDILDTISKELTKTVQKRSLSVEELLALAETLQQMSAGVYHQALTANTIEVMKDFAQ